MKPVSELQKPAQAEFPLASAVSEKALAAAGFSPEAVGEFVRKGVEKLVQKLEATKTTYFAFEGVVIDQREDEDTAAQLKAATELIRTGIDVMGMKKKPADSDSGPKPAINIDLSGWTVQAPKEPLP